MLNKQFYFLAPVEVVRVTRNNLEEVAEWCGGRVATVDSKNVPGRVDSYVWVPTPKGTSISWAFPGMFVTKRLVVSLKDELKATYAVFRRDYFEKNYFDLPIDAVNATWEREAKKQKKDHIPPVPTPAAIGTGAHKTVEEYHKKVQELREEENALHAAELKTFPEIKAVEGGIEVSFKTGKGGIQYPEPGDLSHINEMVRQAVEAEEIHLKREE